MKYRRDTHVWTAVPLALLAQAIMSRSWSLAYIILTQKPRGSSDAESGVIVEVGGVPARAYRFS